ncbi:hypothetical protein LOK49_LG10G02997 [Camellia lanceoleosa]|uniref:Uncharacterized protein n=1 Tax=Camellia lanceoleosa TaxID=1840588 RepID=A0ACC0G820_9ERIC|nr:hypothetical protein LOK49_LG10G02997 [Camellia lanceoleosa]
MASTLLLILATEIVIPVCAVVETHRSVDIAPSISLLSSSVGPKSESDSKIVRSLIPKSESFSLPPYPEAEVIALSPKSLMATNRFEVKELEELFFQVSEQWVQVAECLFLLRERSQTVMSSGEFLTQNLHSQLGRSRRPYHPIVFVDLFSTHSPRCL